MSDLYERGTTVTVNGIDLYNLDEGEGPPVLLLHGFPDSARLWRNQFPALVEAGYRCIAPDLRGFGRSDRPEDVDAYFMLNVTEDLAALLDHLEIDKAHVVGHDWGAGAGWAFASFYPQRVTSLVVLSVGHPLSFGDKTNLQQLAASWYMLFFQFEGIAEEFLTRNDWEFARRWLKDEPDLERYIEDLSRPGALTAALNWYRANMKPEQWIGEPLEWPKVEVPVMGIWSTGDIALTELQMTGSEQYVAGPWRYERIDAPSHWIPLHAPDQLNELLTSFLGA